MWKEVALKLSDKMIALAFWEKFFLILFETQAYYGDDSSSPLTLLPPLPSSSWRPSPPL